MTTCIDCRALGRPCAACAHQQILEDWYSSGVDDAEMDLRYGESFLWIPPWVDEAVPGHAEYRSGYLSVMIREGVVSP